MVKTGILEAERGGLRKIYGIVDSIFTLKTLIDKYVKSKPQRHQNLPFSCFVEIIKSLPLYTPTETSRQTEKKAVQGRFLDVLISIYSNDKSADENDDKLSQLSFTCKGKVACYHLQFYISIGRTTHVTRDICICFPGREKKSL